MNNSNKISRRKFIEKASIGSAALITAPHYFINPLLRNASQTSHIYAAKNGNPQQNLEKVIEMMGGIRHIIDPEDIVILKPNAQWWNQGTTNISAMKKFIELILGIPGFNGEIIIAENHQKSNANSRGWTYQNIINGDSEAINLNALVEFFNHAGYAQVSKYHWISGDKGGKIVTGPNEGDGYVRTDIKYACDGNETIMSYPIFTSVYSGITIDLKHGSWENGGYGGRPIKFINFAVLNHHGRGVTSAVKNFLGVEELPGNDTGMFPDGHYNFHSIGTKGMGGAVGTFLNEIRYPDLNIVTAEWVGWGSRTDTILATQAKTIIASTDPVALDYWDAKYVLYPDTPDDYNQKEYHNPDRTELPFRQYLETCHSQGIGTLNENEMAAQVFDFDKSQGVFANHIVDAKGVLTIGSNYPNPFHSNTIIPFSLSQQLKLKIKIYNVRGQLVKTLIDRVMTPGQYTANWDARDQSGNEVLSGFYLCEFQMDNRRCYIKLVVTK